MARDLLSEGRGAPSPVFRNCLMSVQSLPYVSPIAEPAPVRRRAVEPDSSRDDAAFTLPDDPRQDTAPAAEPARPRAKAEPVAAAAKAEAEPVAKPAAAPVATTAQAAVAVNSAETTQAAPAPATTQPAKLDIGALISIAVAVAGESAAPSKGEKDGETKKVEAEGDAVAAPTPTDLSALLATAPIEPAAATTVPVVQADLSAALLLAPTPVAAPVPAVAEASVETGAIDTAGAKAAVALPGIAVALTAAKPVAPQAAQGIPAEVETDAPTTGEGDKTTASGAGEKPLLHAGKEAAAEPATPAANQSAASGEFKLAEVLQPAQGQIDLSALAQTRLAKPDALPGLAELDQATAGQTATHGQAAANGQATPLHVVPIEIGLRALAGSRQFDIRLDPAELGRVDVSLDISDKGEVKARLVVDRVETLHLLQRDARTLERAFEQAGLKPSDAGVDITLRDPADQSGFRQNRQQDDAPRRTRAAATNDDVAIPTQSVPVRRLVRLGGVDLSI